MRVLILNTIRPQIRSFSSTVLRQGTSNSSSESKTEIFDISTADEKPIFGDESEENPEIEAKRNKSGLLSQHRNVLFNIKPYNESKMTIHDTLKYKRRMLGRYGSEGSGVPVNVSWPKPEEVDEIKEYERVAYPFSIQESWKQIEEKHREEVEKLNAQQKRILENLSKLEGWKKDLLNKIAAKEKAALQAKERKDRLIEEVRRHFGFKINPKDERFKQVLEQKEMEQKKLKKDAKKKARADKILEWAKSNDTKKVETKKENKSEENTTE